MSSLLIIPVATAIVATVLALWWGFAERRKRERLYHENAILRERLNVQAAEYERLDGLLVREREELTEKFSKDFALLAGEILEQKSRSMNETARENMTNILKPLGDNLREFREKIDQESKHRFALQSEVKRLADLNVQMSLEAQNLTEALRGSSKSQGDWGEMILQTLLESSGLKQGIHFKIQENLKSETGQNLRPDVILMMPEDKQVVIDSKVSLTAYITYCEAQSAEAKQRALTAHITSLRSHIAELGTKRYDKLLGGSPDFVIMFVPNEPALLLGLQGHGELWSEAYAKGVIISSPTNLFGILRIVDDLWRRDTQSKYAIEIARQGGDLYDKFVLFAETFVEVGRNIARASEAHDKAMGQLNSGTGNLVRRAERLRELGVKAEKKMPVEVIGALDEEQITDNNELR